MDEAVEAKKIKQSIEILSDSDDEMVTMETPKVSVEKSPGKMSMIKDLLFNPFYNRSKEEQTAVIQEGRPCPELSALKSLHRERFSQYTRSFNTTQYETCKWLTGCDVLNKLYCWPCLLFNRTPNIWNHEGFSNLNCLHSSQRTHRMSVTHLQSVLTLTKQEENLGKTDAALAQNKHKTSPLEHNVNVRKNLDALKKLIDIVFTFLIQDVPFQDDIKGRFNIMLEYVVRDEPALETQLKKSAAFNDLTSIHKCILQAMTEAIYDEISKEIDESHFVALMFDELRDSDQDARISIIVRYVNKSVVRERFLGFVGVTEARTAESLTAYVNELAKRFKIRNKVVAITYNGVKSSVFDEFQKMFLANYQNARFVNCYAHILNNVLAKSLLHVKDCDLFFTALEEIAAFSIYADGKPETLIEYLKDRVPVLTESQWNFSSCLVYNVNVYRNEIIDFFQNVVGTDKRINSKQRMLAIGYLKFLKQFRTMFLLNLFSTIFNSSHKLFEMTQADSFDFVVCKEKADKFLSDLKNLRENGFKILWDFVNERFQPKQKAKKICFGLYGGNGEQETCKELFETITETVDKQTRIRFSEFDKFAFFDLLCNERLETKTVFKIRISSGIVKTLNETYPAITEVTQIRNELRVLYNSTEFGQFKGTPLEKHKWLEEKSLTHSFDGVHRLCSLILTVPLSCDAIPFSESRLNYVERFFRNSTSSNRLDDSNSLLSASKDLLKELKMTRAFYDMVVAKFINLKRDADFQFVAGPYCSF